MLELLRRLSHVTYSNKMAEGQAYSVTEKEKGREKVLNLSMCQLGKHGFVSFQTKWFQAPKSFTAVNYNCIFFIS